MEHNRPKSNMYLLWIPASGLPVCVLLLLFFYRSRGGLSGVLVMSVVVGYILSCVLFFLSARMSQSQRRETDSRQERNA